MNKALLACLAALWAVFYCLPASAQYVPNHALPLGKGAGVSGYGSVGPCASGVPIVGQGASFDPACSSTLASPAMTGTPTAPTPGSNINTTQVPTTAWVNNWFLTIANAISTYIPRTATNVVYVTDYASCDGSDETTALANAVAAANGKVLVFPNGRTCGGRVVVCSTNPCSVYGSLAGGSVPSVINFNGAVIQAKSASFPVVYVELANPAKPFAMYNGNFDGASIAPYGLRVHGSNFGIFENLTEGRSAVGCAFEGTSGYGFYYNKVDTVNCGGSYAANFTLNTANITASISGTTLTVTAASGGPLAVGMGIGGNANITTGTRITALGTGTGGTGTYTVNVSQTVVSEAMVAQAMANTSDGIHEYTMNGASAGCLGGLAYSASNTFVNVSTQYNLGRGWDINCAHNTHVGYEAEQNLGTGVAIAGIYKSTVWLGGYTEANGNSWAGAGATNDASFYNTDSSPGIFVAGGVHTGSFVSVTGANSNEVHVPGISGYGFTANCNGSGHYCATLP